MKLACLLVTVVWLSQDLACRPTLAAESQPNLELKPDPDSLLELTHWTTHGFQEAGIHQAPDKAVFELARERFRKSLHHKLLLQASFCLMQPLLCS